MAVQVAFLHLRNERTKNIVDVYEFDLMSFDSICMKTRYLQHFSWKAGESITANGQELSDWIQLARWISWAPLAMSAMSCTEIMSLSDMKKFSSFVAEGSEVSWHIARGCSWRAIRCIFFDQIIQDHCWRDFSHPGSWDSVTSQPSWKRPVSESVSGVLPSVQSHRFWFLVFSHSMAWPNILGMSIWMAILRHSKVSWCRKSLLPFRSFSVEPVPQNRKAQKRTEAEDFDYRAPGFNQRLGAGKMGHQRSGSTDQTCCWNAKNMFFLPATVCPYYYDSEDQWVPGDAGRERAAGHLIRGLGSNYRQFDPRGKEAYLDQIALVQAQGSMFSNSQAPCIGSGFRLPFWLKQNWSQVFCGLCFLCL